MQVSAEKIANFIADIQQAQDSLAEARERRVKLQDELEGLDDDIQSDEAEIQRLRDALDDYIDELIPEEDKATTTKYGGLRF